VVGTLAADDLVMSVGTDPGLRFHASAFGLLVLAAWSSLAIVPAPGGPGIGRRDEDRGGERQTRPRRQHQQAEGAGIAPPDAGPARRRHDRLTPLAVLLLVWAGLHVVQFLMLGAAADPGAAAWYRLRAGLGQDGGKPHDDARGQRQGAAGKARAEPVPRGGPCPRASSWGLPPS
jgi:hypothetical protein